MNENTSIATATPLSTKQRAHALYIQLEQCLEANSSAGSNPDTLRQMKSFGLALKRTSSFFDEKVESFLSWAEILYSPRKHDHWKSSHQSGAEAVAHYMRCDLVSIRTILNRMNECP